jgi:CheY-like chemotaxis protein
MENIPTWALILVQVLALFGVAKLVELGISRRWSKKDEKVHTTQQNEAHALAADTQFRADLMSRIKSLEEAREKRDSEFNSQTVELTAVKIENKHLEAQNTRQETELDRLRITNEEQQRQIISLEKRFEVIQHELTIVTAQSNNLQRQLNEMMGSRDVEIEKEILRRLGARRHSSHLSIAIVENDEATVDLFKSLFKMSDIEYAMFADGKGALNWLRDNEPTAIVVDLALGGDIDGLTLVERIRGHERRNKLIPARIILYTGYPVTDAIKADAERYSVEAILTKSIHTPQFVLDLILGNEPKSE